MGSALGKQRNMVQFKLMAFKCINAQDQIHQISYEYFLLSSSLFCELVINVTSLWPLDGKYNA